MYLISGFFKMPYEGIISDHSPELLSMAGCTHSNVGSFLFSGYLVNDPRSPLGDMVGEISDPFGLARLRDVKLSERRLEFVKEYRDIPLSGELAPILYDLALLDDGTWDGLYEVGGVSGPVRCLLTEVEDLFFNEPVQRSNVVYGMRQAFDD